MKSYEEYLATSADTPAFANGSEYSFWEWNVCDGARSDLGSRCANDTTENPCPLLYIGMIDHKHPAEWTGPYARYDCSEYTPREET